MIQEVEARDFRNDGSEEEGKNYSLEIDGLDHPCSGSQVRGSKVGKESMEVDGGINVGNEGDTQKDLHSFDSLYEEVD